MRSTAPGPRDSRPPVAITAAPGAEGRRSVWRRPLVVPLVWGDGKDGFPPHHPYVRRFWSAVMGPGAVADLLRLVAAGRRSSSIPRPERLHLLIQHGLAGQAGGVVWVRPVVPPLGPAQLRLVPPSLRTEHLRVIESFFGR